MSFKVIEPITITDTILTGSNVPEADYNEWQTDSQVFSALSQTSRNWIGMCAAPNGNIYVCVYNGDIYMQTAGAGNFVALNQTSRKWVAMCAAPNGNVYASVEAGDIYMQTAGAGNFVALSQTSRNWYGMCAAPNGNVYASVSGGDIYMQTAGTGNFVALSQTGRSWRGMCAAPNGNVYAVVPGGDIYMQTAGSGDFAALGQTSRNWYYMCAAPNGNIYAGVNGGDIYIQESGVGTFASTGQSTRQWFGMCAAPNGNVYAAVLNGDIYMQPNRTGLYFINDYVMVTTPNVHNIYQSLKDNNYNHDPADDDQDSPVYWLLIGSTNRWKCFNNVLGSQTSQATKIEYVLTPGESINSCALFNIDSDTVDIVEIDSADDLVTNGQSFTGATGTTEPDDWDKVKTPADYTIDSGAIKITTNDTNEGMSQTITVLAETEYQLLFLYKNTSGDTAQYAVYDVTHSADIKATTDLTSDTAYASNSYVFTTPAGCTSIKISFLGKANGDIVWFDNIRLCPTEYSETVTTGSTKTSVVKMDIPAIATGILTVTINKSTTAKIGELIIGNYTSLGTMRYSPQIGYRNYSTFEEDTWGNLSIVERSYARKMNCNIIVTNTSLDTVDKFLCDHMNDMMVWVGSADYNCLQVYGFCKEPQIVVSYKNYSDLSLEIWGVV